MTLAKLLGIFASICLLLSSYPLFSQTPGIDKLDVYTKTVHRHASSGGNSLHADSIRARLNSIPDSATVYVTLVVTLSNPAETDSLILTLTNSADDEVYNTQVALGQMEGESGFGALNKTFRIKVGPYAYMKHFTATAAAIGNSITSSVVTFTKN